MILVLFLTFIAVRNSFHGPGASAGINIEDKRVYEFSCSQTKSESKKRERSKCDGKKKENTCEYRYVHAMPILQV